MNDLVKQQLNRALEQMKRQADKNRTEREFAVSKLVYLKLQPYIQSSVARRANHKLAFKFFGPFKIIGKVGVVAYKLLLPPSSAIHPVFHVSQLKKAVPMDQHVTASIPDLTNDKKIPVAILQKRLSATSPEGEVLTQWSGWPPSLATWENIVDLRRRFPGSSALGLAGSFGGGVSAPLLLTLITTSRKRLMGRDKEKAIAGPTRG
jgi:hypothetical protein